MAKAPEPPRPLPWPAPTTRPYGDETIPVSRTEAFWSGLLLGAVIGAVAFGIAEKVAHHLVWVN